MDETARRILFDSDRLPGRGRAGHPRAATNPFADWRLVRSGPPLVRLCPVLPPLPRKGISPARTLRRPGKASVRVKTTLVIAAGSPQHHCWHSGFFATTPASELHPREASALRPERRPAPKSGPSSGSLRRPPRSRPDAPRATLGPAGDARIIRLVASAGSGRIETVSTGMGLRASTLPPAHHVAAMVGRPGLVCRLVSAPRASSRPPAAARATSGCPVPTSRDARLRPSEDGFGLCTPSGRLDSPSGF